MQAHDIAISQASLDAAQKALDDVLADLSSVPRPLWTRGPLQSPNKSVRTLADFTYD